MGELKQSEERELYPQLLLLISTVLHVTILSVGAVTSSKMC